MSYRTQKHRALKLEEEASSDSSDTQNLSESDLTLNLSTSTSMMNISSNSSKGDVSTSRHDTDFGENRPYINIHLSETSFGSEYAYSEDLETSVLSDADEQPKVPSSPEEIKNLREKLRDCAIKHSNHITHIFLNDLLRILRSEGHTDLPKTAETLLHTQRSNDRIQPMLSKKGTYGSYMYLGIKDQLQIQITNSGYEDKEIQVLVNVDGLPIFARSKQQMWPILIQILHKDYYCKPFVVALYCGDSKPHEANNFFHDFIEEITVLMKQGLHIENSLFSFRIAAFVCNTPARAFIKCCKGHAAFYGCERCEVHGKTVNKRRVYPEMNCRLRTRNSFIEKRQPDHHVLDTTSPLVRIPKFDPVRGVVLDYMHFLRCGVMKSLFEKWLSTRKQKGNIGRRERHHLTELLFAISLQIPMEFQRKLLDITDIVNWKATQYRFVLLYAGGLILRQVLSSKVYYHFLLVFIACRILCSQTWALMYTNEAESFLREFFENMSTLYGKDSQTMNFHNLIHLADDVRNLQAPLTKYSSFPFENCLGNIKRLIRTPRNPVAQVFRRLSEKQCLSSVIKKYEFRINNSEDRMPQDEHTAEINTMEYTKISIKSITVGIAAPDNVVKLANDDIFQVSRIFHSVKNSKLIFIEGKPIEKKGNAFTKPMASLRIGIYKIGCPFRSRKVYLIDNIVGKCIVMNVEGRKYAVTLLHVQ